jgi:hypothetical protein
MLQRKPPCAVSLLIMKRPIMFCKIVNWATFPVLWDGEVGIQDITTPFFLYTSFFSSMERMMRKLVYSQKKSMQVLA